jgi:hypothetical protein
MRKSVIEFSQMFDNRGPFERAGFGALVGDEVEMRDRAESDGAH